MVIAGIFLLSIVANASELPNGKQTYIDNCVACHGDDGHGIKDQGASLVTSKFIKSSSDSEVADFIKTGRQPDAPDSTMKLLMPAFDYLTDKESGEVIAFIRSLK